MPLILTSLVHSIKTITKIFLLLKEAKMVSEFGDFYVKCNIHIVK